MTSMGWLTTPTTERTSDMKSRGNQMMATRKRMMSPPMPYLTIFFFFCPLGCGYFCGDGAQGDEWGHPPGATPMGTGALGSYLLRLAAALDDEDVGVDVFHAHPVGQGQRGVRPHPVHDGAQLHQEGHKAKPVGDGDRGLLRLRAPIWGHVPHPVPPRVPYPWKRKRLRWLYFLVRKLPRMRVG